MKKIRTILLIALGVAVLALAGFVKYVMRDGTMPEPDYDDPESLPELAFRTETYIIRANPDRESPARKEALKALNDIALLDIPDKEKRRLIRERFPEESFWPDELKALLKQAEAGDAEAQYRLGRLYYIGLSPRNEEDRELRKHIVICGPLEAKWLRRAALQGHADAQFLLAMSYASGSHPFFHGDDVLSKARKSRISSETVEWYEKAGGNGCPYAIAMGYGVPEGVNPEEWRKKGAAMLSEDAERGGQLALAKSKQPPEVYLKAVANGSVLAMLKYADLLRQTDPARKIAPDAEPDEAAADEWDRKALAAAVKQLEEGEPDGLECMIGYQYDRNVSEMLDTMIGTETPEAFANRVIGIMWDGLEQGTYQDYGLLWSIRQYGKEWEWDVNDPDDVAFFRRAAEYQPFYRSVYVRMLFERAEKEQDAPNENTPALMAETVGLLRILAGFGDSDAQTMLGECYLYGIGVPKDKVRAVEWFRRAAEQKKRGAVYILADECIRDDGAPPGWFEAKKWRWRETHFEEEWTGTDGLRSLFSEWYDAACDFLDKIEKMF